MIRLIGRSKLNPYFYGQYKVVNKQKFNTAVLEDLQIGKLLDRNVHIKKFFSLHTSRTRINFKGRSSILTAEELINNEINKF